MHSSFFFLTATHLIFSPYYFLCCYNLAMEVLNLVPGGGRKRQQENKSSRITTRYVAKPTSPHPTPRFTCVSLTPVHVSPLSQQTGRDSTARDAGAPGGGAQGGYEAPPRHHHPSARTQSQHGAGVSPLGSKCMTHGANRLLRCLPTLGPGRTLLVRGRGRGRLLTYMSYGYLRCMIHVWSKKGLNVS